MKALSQWTPKLVYFGILLLMAWKIISIYSDHVAEVNQAIDFK
jgi:hypothetical protein